MSINAIKTNMLGIQQAKTNIKTDVNEEKNTQTSAHQTATQNKQISADEIFKFMSATTPVQMKRAVNVKAFVNSESENRIADSMKNFETQFNAKFSLVKSEFGNISDKLAEKITLSMF